MRFYKCRECGSILISDKAAACCGEALEELIPNTTDAAGEKHVPAAVCSGSSVNVTVGTVEHPMLEVHYIMWIVLETSKGYQKKDLLPGEKPAAVFTLTEGETPVAAYEYCNLHGLWKAEI